MPKLSKVEAPWFGSFTPASEGGVPPLIIQEEPQELTPEAVAAVPNTYPAGRTYEGFLYELISSGIAGMGDTVITTPSNGQILTYDSGLGKWTNQSAATAGNLDSLSDVIITTPASGQIISYNGTNWVNGTGAFLPLVGGTITGTPGTLTVNAPNGATGAINTVQVNGSRRLLVSADSDHILELTDTSNTGPTATLRISHRTSSGTPATGFGSALQFWGEDTAHTNVEFATIRTEASDNTPGAVSSDLVFINKIAGTSTEGLRFKGSDGRAIFAGALQSPALHVGDLVTHPATANFSRSSGASNPSLLTYLRVKGVADTAVAGDPLDVEFNLSRTLQLSTGNRAFLQGLLVTGPTYSAVGASTIDEAAGVFLNSLPVAGTNVTLTNRYALYVNGPSRFESGSSGGITYVWKLPTDNTALTGGITGRIPINISGNLRYIPYYTS